MIVNKHITARDALLVFNTIQSKGESTDNGYVYHQLTAQSSYDGYTIMISNYATTLYVYFHNKFKLDGGDKRSIEDFYQKFFAVMDK